jgi:hypothetical protein
MTPTDLRCREPKVKVDFTLTLNCIALEMAVSVKIVVNLLLLKDNCVLFPYS